MLGWGFYGGINVFAFMYYANIYYGRYTSGIYQNIGLATRTVWGMSNYIRVVSSVIFSFFFTFLWVLTFIPAKEMWYIFYYATVYGFSAFYFLRIATMVVMQCLAFGIDKTATEWSIYGYFKDQVAIGTGATPNH